MVVQGILALALALPTGLLFGVGYGTGVRIGYEQVYPLLFPKPDVPRTPEQTANQIKQINKIYDTIGGKEASQMGIANGLAGAMQELDKNPDFRDLEALESRLSGRTPSNLDPHKPSKPTTNSDSTSVSSPSSTRKPTKTKINTATPSHLINRTKIHTLRYTVNHVPWTVKGNIPQLQSELLKVAKYKDKLTASLQLHKSHSKRRSILQQIKPLQDKIKLLAGDIARLMQ
jgi:hypothetical protein